MRTIIAFLAGAAAGAFGMKVYLEWKEEKEYEDIFNDGDEFDDDEESEDDSTVGGESEQRLNERMEKNPAYRNTTRRDTSSDTDYQAYFPKKSPKAVAEELGVEDDSDDSDPVFIYTDEEAIPDHLITLEENVIQVDPLNHNMYNEDDVEIELDPELLFGAPVDIYRIMEDNDEVWVRNEATKTMFDCIVFEGDEPEDV